MKILKKIIYILALVLITSCGYEPIFSKKNYNFSIAKIDTYGDKKLSSKIARNLNNINKLNNSNKIIKLKLTQDHTNTKDLLLCAPEEDRQVIIAFSTTIK